MNPEALGAADLLRGYLDRIGFQQIYKFITGVNQYAVAPSMIAKATASDVARFFDTVLYDQSDLQLLQCLLFGRPARFDELSRSEAPVAEALVRGGVLGDDEQRIVPADYQLISAFGVDLLVDRRIHFGGIDIHEVYIGPDSYFMLYYVDTRSIRREHRALDLCTGTGISALYLSLFSDHVLATDIGAAPLKLVRFNRRLNHREERVEIREQDLRETLQGGERFDVLTCNPPFVAYPPGLQGTLYSHGAGIDGLDYMRKVIDRAPDALNPGGCAYLVADLPGDEYGPYFVDELKQIAATSGMAVDVYIDNVIPAELQVPPLAAYLEQLNPGQSRAEISLELESFQQFTLKASRYYMSTVRLQPQAARQEVRVLRRYLLPRYGPADLPAEEEWPALLLQN